MPESRPTILGELFAAGLSGNRVLASLVAAFVLALTIGTGVGLAGPLAVVVGLILFVLVGTALEIRSVRRLRKRALVGGVPLDYLDPIDDFDIHPWLGGGPESELPEFVERRALKQALKGLAERRFVVLTGPPESGKSRLAYEAVSRAGEIAIVARPASSHGEDPLIALMNKPHGFMAMQEKQVLLLTDLGARLTAGLISGESIREWLDQHPRISVIAILGSKDLAEIEAARKPVVSEMRKLKKEAVVVPVLSRLFAEELEDARAKFSQVDPEQLPQLTKYLAGGMPLHEVLESAETERPLGYGIVCAVADWRRAGNRRPAPFEFVRDVALKLAGDVTASFSEEMAWALEPHGPAAALIYRVESDGEKGLAPDNIVVGLFDERQSLRPIASETWQAVQGAIEGRIEEVGKAEVAAELLSHADAALARERPDIAHPVLDVAARLGDSAQQRQAVDIVMSDRETPLVESRRGDGVIQRLKPVKRLAEGRRYVAGRAMLGGATGEGWVIAWIYRQHALRSLVRILLLALADIASTAVGLFVGLTIRAALSDTPNPIASESGVSGSFVALWAAVTVFVFASTRLYRKEMPRARIAGIAAALFAFVVFGLVVSLAEGVNVGVSVLTVAGGGLVAFSLDFVFRYAYDEVSRKWVRDRGLEARTLLVGSAEQVVAVERALKDMSRPSRMIGYLEDASIQEEEDDKDEEEEDVLIPEAPMLGGIDDLRMVSSKHGVGRVVIADTDMPPAERQDLADRCHELGLPVEAIASVADIRGGGGVYIVGQPLVLLALLPLWQRNTWFFIKRTVDFVASLVLITILSPLLGLVALAVLLLEGRPVVVRSWRPGLGGDPFHMYRFRTAIDELSSRIDLLDDEPDHRVERTWLGNFLRDRGIDELPQLFNILRGHMSLVGPRPLELSNHVRLSDLDLLRYVVRPGATGPWQVCSRKFLSYAELTSMDMAYLRRWTIFTDLEILARTAMLVLFGRDAVPAIDLRGEPAADAAASAVD